MKNRRIVLASRPQGAPKPQDFRLEETAVPEPGDGQMLLQTLYLSLDPYMRGLMNEIPPAYAAGSIPVDGTMVGGTVSRVVRSHHPKFREGDVVLAKSGWQDYALSDGEGLMQLGAMERPSLALGGLGMPAFTAYVGLLDIGQPQSGETVVVAAATGAVGAIVGQIAKLKGARVVGIVGGADKARHAVEELGFDICLDRRDPDLAQALKQACPNGIDVYFENVGGEVFDAVLPLLNVGARVPVIGVIAHYDDMHPAGPDRLPNMMATVLAKRVRVEGMIILDHYNTRHDAFQRDMAEWIAAGKMKLTEDVVNGLENAPEAFIGMLQGRNFGKIVIRVAD